MKQLIVPSLIFIGALLAGLSGVFAEWAKGLKIFIAVAAAFFVAIASYYSNDVSVFFEPILTRFLNTPVGSNEERNEIIAIRKEYLSEARQHIPAQDSISDMMASAEQIKKNRIALQNDIDQKDKILNNNLRNVGEPVLDAVLKEFDDYALKADKEGIIQSNEISVDSQEILLVGISEKSRRPQPINQEVRKFILKNGGQVYVKVNTAYAKNNIIQGGHIIIEGGSEHANFEFYGDLIVVEIQGNHKEYKAEDLNSKDKTLDIVKDIGSAVSLSFRGAYLMGLEENN